MHAPLSPHTHRRSRIRRYELFGLVEHSGTYRDGHYTAFVRVGGSTSAMTAASSSSAPSSQNGGGKEAAWNLFSDSKVTSVTEQQVKDAQAFLLFYVRVKE